MKCMLKFGSFWKKPLRAALFTAVLLLGSTVCYGVSSSRRQAAASAFADVFLKEMAKSVQQAQGIKVEFNQTRTVFVNVVRDIIDVADQHGAGDAFVNAVLDPRFTELAEEGGIGSPKLSAFMDEKMGAFKDLDLDSEMDAIMKKHEAALAQALMQDLMQTMQNQQ